MGERLAAALSLEDAAAGASLYPGVNASIPPDTGKHWGRRAGNCPGAGQVGTGPRRAGARGGAVGPGLLRDPGLVR
jgi:hypothetical protein